MIVDKRLFEEDPTQMNEYASALDSQALARRGLDLSLSARLTEHLFPQSASGRAPDASPTAPAGSALSHCSLQARSFLLLRAVWIYPSLRA